MAGSAMYIKPDADLEKIKDKILYYPFSGSDWFVPIKLFRGLISEFWFVDSNYSFGENETDQYNMNSFPDMTFLEESFMGERVRKDVEILYTDKVKPYRYLEPGFFSKKYRYQNREITIVFRRGYDYTSLFGPSSLEIAEERIGIFFLRGTSSEGGSNHPWNHSLPIKILRGHKKVSLPRKLVNTLPDGGLIATDGSLSFPVYPVKGYVNEFEPFSKFTNMVSGEEAMEKAKPFFDKEGNLFTCIGYANRRNRPTLIWQVSKQKFDNQNK